MAEVVVISTSLVGAPSPATGERSSNNGVGVSRVDLTPWDLQFLQVATIQKGLLFRKPNPQQQQEPSLFSSTPKLIHHLKASLSSALSFYPPAAGRFAEETNEENHTSTLHVDCNNAGVEFVQAKAAGVTVAAILDPSNAHVSEILRSFFPLNGIRNVDGIAKPLMGVQVTELHDGYFIACTLNHALADGTSFWNFFRSWSEMSRGCPQISKPPSLKRWFSGSIPCPIPLPPHREFHLEIFSSSSPRTETIFRLSQKNIAKLKERANSEVMVSAATATAPIISSLMSYMAHLWRSVTRARNLDANEDVHIMVIVGARQRMNIPEGYWGNAVVFETVTAKAGEVLGEGLGWAALQMKRGVQKCTEQEMMNQYVSWAKSPNFAGEKGLPANVLAISSSPRFDVYGTDFGWGQPVAVRSGGGNKFDGKATLFAGREEGSVEIELCLHPNTLLALRNDPEILEYVTF